MRVIPFPPAGQPSVCFGSSVIIGPASVADRPFADIATADLETAYNQLYVTYRSGGAALLGIGDVTRERGNVLVQVGYSTSESLCTFRSNFAAEGKSDCDHVIWQSQGQSFTNSIMSFIGGPATNWFFFRQSISSTRPSAPDITITAEY